jgi:hypothetical protein
MFGSHLIISAVLAAATVAACVTYLVHPPIAREKDGYQLRLERPSVSGPDTTASISANRHPVSNDTAAKAYLEAAQAILRQMPIAQASASADQLPTKGRIPLPRKRPIPRH